jgi:hypothetical protein
MKAGESIAMWAGLGLVAFIAVVWLAKKAGAGLISIAPAVGQAVNPVSDQNLAYKGATAVTQVFTGKGETLGTWFYDMTHGAQVKQIQAMTGPIIPDATPAPAPFKPRSYYDLGAKLPFVNSGSLIH